MMAVIRVMIGVEMTMIITIMMIMMMLVIAIMMLMNTMVQMTRSGADDKTSCR